VTTHRRYSFQHPVERRTGHELVLQVLERACGLHWWYREPEVTGMPFARLSFAFTVSGRDQWWAHRRAMLLAEACYRSLMLGPKSIPEPMWEVLEPHTNRGRYRTPG